MKFEFVKHNANDVPLDPEMYFNAYQNGMSFSQFLENIDPTEPADKSGLDAFERQLMRFGIRTKDDPKLGIQASKGEMFFQSNLPASRILFPEYLNRVARVAAMDQQDLLNEIVAGMETISDQGIYRSLYIDDTQAARTRSRVGERGAFPVVKISWSEKATTLTKYGVAIQMSYEFVRRASLPIISIFVQRIMLQTRLDEVGEAIAALLAGDGSGHTSGGAITAEKLGDDYQGGAPTGTESLTYTGYLSWLYSFYPGKCTTVLGKAHDILLMMTMPKPTTDPFWLFSLLSKKELGGVPMLVNGMAPETVRYVIHDGACTEDYIIGIDKSAALFGYREAGADLTETNKIINGQWNEIVISNTIGFQTLFASARKQLQMND